MTMFYCRKCQVLVDKSQVTQVTATLHTHTMSFALTADSEAKSVTHEVVSEDG